MRNALVKFSHDGWLVRAAPGHERLARLLTRFTPPPPPVEPLRDDYRSYVGVFEVEGRRVVAKSPRMKNRASWNRLTTLLRTGESTATVTACLAVRSDGIPVPEYICSLERRSLGMIVDSWMFYLFVPGVPCGSDQYGLVVESLASLHRAGWVHGDPHIANFLRVGDGVQILDCRPRPARFGSLSECYDFVRLVNSEPDLAPHLGSRARTLPYRVARAYDRAIHGWRDVKREVRSGIGRPRRLG
ncbi:MAG: hypothetical protein FJY88_00870 [Candidatus Eisenbacteria bacterium]|nr:hypothetical protein [Candidatus Eisenbacteria bacterium]